MADTMRSEARAGGDAAGARRSPCPVAGALDLVGDRWTLLLIRDMAAGKRRFGDFLGSPERIPTNILADRLKRLERAGLVHRVPYSAHPPRMEYHLASAGLDLVGVVRCLADWGLKHIPGTRQGIVMRHSPGE
jgi:DNA-binding HxlR family transcriptional regulator